MNTAETFATPIAKSKTVGGRQAEQTPESPLQLSALEAATQTLENFVTGRGHLTHLLHDIHTWSSCSQHSTPVTPARPPAAAVVAAVPYRTAPHQSPLRPANKRSVPTPPEVTDLLRTLQTTLEDTQQIASRCQQEIAAVLSRQSSVTASAIASYGVSNTNSPCDPHQSSGEGLLHAYHAAADSAVVVVGDNGAVPATSIASDDQRSENEEEGKDDETATTATVETQAYVQQVTPSHPCRMPWPAAQFCYVVHVEFKRGRVRRFFSRVPVPTSDYAIVPGDRGYDCGLVIQCALWNPHRQGYDPDTIRSADPEVWPPGTHSTIMEIIRIATDEEVARLHDEHVSMERLGLSTCNEVAERLRLPMLVQDCEYQFDGTKITFFFTATQAIDFRQLNKELFRIFNARIWMQNINAAVRNSAPPSALVSKPWRSHTGHPSADV